MTATTDEVQAAGSGLVVNFEFEIEGVIYVTRAYEHLQHGVHDIYAIKSYPLERKVWQIVCPRDPALLFGPSVCPFEGDMPASIQITTGEGSVEDATGHNTKMKIRQVPDASGGGQHDASPQWMSYTIAGMPGEGSTFVTVEQAVFSKCQSEWEYKTFTFGEALYSCNESLVQAGKALAFEDENYCDEPYKVSYEPRLQTDRLSIRQFSGNGGEPDHHDVYDHTFEITKAMDRKVNRLLAGGSVQIEILVDAYECVGENTGMSISITFSRPPAVLAPVGGRLLAYASSVPTCKTKEAPVGESCACIVPDTTTVSPWPSDECNGCVFNGQAEVCDGMGVSLIMISPITYNLFISNIVVKADSVGVAKVKRSRRFNSEVPSKSGVEYEHLNIRTVGLTLALRTTGQGGGEIAEYGADSGVLPVHFEFYIDGQFYVTEAVQKLQYMKESATSDYWTPVHHQYQTMFADSSDTVWSQIITVDRKQFEVVCTSIDDEIACPYEGSVKTVLNSTSAVSQQVSKEHKYSIRKLTHGNNLWVTLVRFRINECDVKAVYKKYPQFDVICDPLCYDPLLLDCTGYSYAEICANDQYETVPQTQTDMLSVTHYTHVDGRENEYFPCVKHTVPRHGFSATTTNCWKLCGRWTVSNAVRPILTSIL